MKYRNLIPRRILISVAIILLMVVMPLTAAAELPELDGNREKASIEASAKPSIYITWKDIVKAVDKHPLVLAGQNKISAAKENINASGAIPNPEIEFSTLHGQPQDNSGSTTEWGVGVTIPLDWLAKRSSRINMATAEAKTAKEELKALRRDILLQLRILFWNLAYEQEHVVVLNELSSQMVTLSKTIKKRVEKGEVRPIEATRIEIEAEKIAGELEAAKSKLTANRDILATWLGGSKDKRMVAKSDIDKLPQPISAELAKTKAGDHPQIAAAKAQIQALSKKITLERRERIPSFSLKAYSEYEPDRDAYGIELAIDLPFWNWNTGNIKHSEYMLAAEKNKFKAEKLELETLAIDAQSACESGVALAICFKEQILPRAISVTKTIERTYEVGEATLLEVIDARRILLETKRQYLKTLLNMQIDYGRLQTITEE